MVCVLSGLEVLFPLQKQVLLSELLKVTQEVQIIFKIKELDTFQKPIRVQKQGKIKVTDKVTFFVKVKDPVIFSIKV